jgi:septum formation protein
MHTKKRLYLGSSSMSRRRLLKGAGIGYELVAQSADEQKCDWGLPLQKLVESIAVFKMEHVQLPDGHEGDRCFVLTADTLGVDHKGTICGKPSTIEKAKAMIRSFRYGARTGTGVCIDRRIFCDGVWSIEARVITYADATYVYDVPENYIDRYVSELKKYSDLECTQVSGGIAIEGYGNRFLKRLEGSYTAVVGLPLYEMQQALSELGFFE